MKAQLGYMIGKTIGTSLIVGGGFLAGWNIGSYFERLDIVNDLRNPNIYSVGNSGFERAGKDPVSIEGIDRLRLDAGRFADYIESGDIRDLENRYFAETRMRQNQD